MNRYWLKIVAGALVVFGVGLVLVRVGHRTIETVQTITDSAASISVPLFGLVGFRVDGQRRGEIRRRRPLFASATSRIKKPAPAGSRSRESPKGRRRAT